MLVYICGMVPPVVLERGDVIHLFVVFKVTSDRVVARLVLPNKSADLVWVSWHTAVGRCYDAGSVAWDGLLSEVKMPLKCPLRCE